MRIKLFAAALLSIAALASVSSAYADPVGGPNAEVFTLDCEGLGVLDVAVTGNGPFTPGHVIGTNQILIPVAFEITGTFTPVDGEPQEFSDQSSRNAPKNKELFDCVFHDEGSDEFGSFVIDGTATVYVVGK
jgi:hypothetical protein